MSKGPEISPVFRPQRTSQFRLNQRVVGAGRGTPNSTTDDGVESDQSSTAFLAGTLFSRTRKVKKIKKSKKK